MKKFFGNPVIVVLCLCVFPPLGIFLMHYFTDWPNGWKMALSVIFAAIFIIAIVQAINEEAAYLAKQSMAMIVNRI